MRPIGAHSSDIATKDPESRMNVLQIWATDPFNGGRFFLDGQFGISSEQPSEQLQVQFQFNCCTMLTGATSDLNQMRVFELFSYRSLHVPLDDVKVTLLTLVVIAVQYGQKDKVYHGASVPLFIQVNVCDALTVN